ncbi:PREDICTED: E3 ubiquitin-protein ligase PUB23-like [Nelumbo nucifera]|uniref:U-box domain-containing protein n=2 Tax=Nelumbo nucifera TaxID=4432 RepID=A0A822YZL5_NELNU|nr:PREDICTED: E3 ubiquitin-protein ligase PUB23-like [Nelumbo nucifera]DAD36196.1 TPA_asm: hypothetical protein HUJ06_006836 [Nelumbo nucifera]
MEGPEVPSFFVCPISLQLMKDPVTISTGMTYDRESIHRWFFYYNNNTCPVTKQLLTDQSLTPNSTLLRLIESWCHKNQYSVSSTTTESPNLAPDISTLLSQLVEEVRNPELQIKSLGKIKSLIQGSDGNRVSMEDAGFALVVASLIVTQTNPQPEGRTISELGENKSVVVEEAVTVLYLLKPTTETLKKISQDRNGQLIGSLSLMIQQGSYRARSQAALLLKNIFRVVDDIYKAKLKTGLFEGIVEILKDQISNRASKAVLSILMEVMPFVRNRVKAVEAGIVGVLVELLAESNEKRSCEIMLGVVEQLCGRAEGRSAFLAHPASVAAVSTKILRVSHVANDKAVAVLLLVCRFCNKGGVVGKELMEVGAIAKLCMLVVQVECSVRTKDKAKEILGFHLKAWSKSPCFPSYLKCF